MAMRRLWRRANGIQRISINYYGYERRGGREGAESSVSEIRFNDTVMRAWCAGWSAYSTVRTGRVYLPLGYASYGYFYVRLRFFAYRRRSPAGHSSTRCHTISNDVLRV